MEKTPKPANDTEASPVLGMSEVLAEIGIIRQRIEVGGGVDDERRQLDSIVIAVRNGTKTPIQGLAEARAIEEARQNYH